MDPKVSFITGVKNRSEELKEMIESLLKQDMPEWEAIIVDDHSDEPIKELVESFHDPRLNYFRLPENMTGISNARNFAVSKARAEILLTADGDDINEPDRARVIYDLMAKNNYDVFYSNMYDYFPAKNKKIKRKFQPFNAALFKMFNFMTNPGTAFRKSKFLEVEGFDPGFVVSEDYDLWLRILNAGAKFGYTEKILVNYRYSANSLSRASLSRIHDYVMKTRIKNKIPPFDIGEIKKYALPEIAEQVLSKRGREVWQDDRFVNVSRTETAGR
ncbi:MAG: glycosyltransferase [Patescibacteria group bacterium]